MKPENSLRIFKAIVFIVALVFYGALSFDQGKEFLFAAVLALYVIELFSGVKK